MYDRRGGQRNPKTLVEWLLFLKKLKLMFVHLFTFWGREAPPSMQSDWMLGGSPTPKSDESNLKILNQHCIKTT